ncbi:MAG: hypothetical protein IJ758_01825 [Clostridia bacterium]|nr:hypothetical protein [Clostridia bacterium]
MNRTENLFKKQFTYIKDIQDMENIYYNLYETDIDSAPTYGVEIISEKDTIREKTSLKQISDSKSFIVDIIRYLYENSIRPESACGIISDLINENFFKKLT